MFNKKWKNQYLKAFNERHPDIAKNRSKCYVACYKYVRTIKCPHTSFEPKCALCNCLLLCKQINIRNIEYAQPESNLPTDIKLSNKINKYRGKQTRQT